MKYDLLAVAAIAVFVLVSYYGFTIVFLFFLLPLVGYQQIRRLGYSPSKAGTLVLGVTVVSVLATISIAVFVPTLDGPWGILGIILLYVGIPMSIRKLFANLSCLEQIQCER